jgi:hypothetical protein
MANKRIIDLPENAPARGSWFVAEVYTGGDFTTSKAQLSSIFNVAQDPLIASSTQTVFTLSSQWNSVYQQYSLTERQRLLSTDTTTRDYSGLWTGTYTTVSINQSRWNNAPLTASVLFSIVSPNSANWNNVYTSTRTASGNWDDAYRAVNVSYRPLSGNWNSVYSYVYNNSARGTGNLAPGFARRYAVDVGDGIASSFAIPHGMDNRYVTVQVFRKSTGLTVTPASITYTDANNVTITFPSPAGSQEYGVVVVG